MGPRMGDMAAIVWLLKAQQASKIQLIRVLRGCSVAIWSFFNLTLICAPTGVN